MKPLVSKMKLLVSKMKQATVLGLLAERPITQLAGRPSNSIQTTAKMFSE
jgi:hypothetical protein